MYHATHYPRSDTAVVEGGGEGAWVAPRPLEHREEGLVRKEGGVGSNTAEGS